MILLIDNYDSFVHNLARYIIQLGSTTHIIRNDVLTVAEIVNLHPEKIIISPGPGEPGGAGIAVELVKQLGNTIPILGVCLGHQVIAQAYGCQVVRANKPMHGKSSLIYHRGQNLFQDMPSPLKVGRYHSLIVSKEQLPNEIEIIAESEQGEIMALRHKLFPVYGVQFHPESVNTEKGYELLNNFLTIT